MVLSLTYANGTTPRLPRLRTPLPSTPQTALAHGRSKDS